MRYLCPICKQALLLEGKSLRCQNRHTFDIAKEGYVNLLPVGKKNNLDPGDNKEMVLSRENFLTKGYFDELASTLVSIVSDVHAQTLLDVGTGTGYYARKMPIVHYGIDISKHAVRMASIKDKSGFYAVASAFDLPFHEGQFDVLLNCFAPKAPLEYQRVLKEDGVLIEVVPAKNHLIELKERLYEVVRLNEEKPALDGFSLTDQNRVTYQKLVLASDVNDLLTMTPYRYKTKPNAFEHLTGNLLSTFDFDVRIWKK